MKGLTQLSFDSAKYGALNISLIFSLDMTLALNIKARMWIILDTS